MTCTEAAPDQNNGTGTAAIGAAQDIPIQHTEYTVTGLAMTHHTSHTTNPPCTTACQATALRTAVDHTCNHPTNCLSMVHTNRGSCSSGSYSNQGNQKPNLRRNIKVQIDELPLLQFIHSTDLGEESESLN